MAKQYLIINASASLQVFDVSIDAERKQFADSVLHYARGKDNVGPEGLAALAKIVEGCSLDVVFNTLDSPCWQMYIGNVSVFRGMNGMGPLK